MTPEEMVNYCKKRKCNSENKESNCEYNCLCCFTLKMKSPENIDINNTETEDYTKLKALCSMINKGIENDIPAVIKYLDEMNV